MRAEQGDMEAQFFYSEENTDGMYLNLRNKKGSVLRNRFVEQRG